jgi:hypothetical protein
MAYGCLIERALGKRLSGQLLQQPGIVSHFLNGLYTLVN